MLPKISEHYSFLSLLYKQTINYEEIFYKLKIISNLNNNELKNKLEESVFSMEDNLKFYSRFGKFPLKSDTFTLIQII